MYQSLYDTCYKADVTECGKYSSFREWQEDPQTWWLLGEYARKLQEPLIARDCYKIYLDQVDYRGLRSELDGVTIEKLMIIAKNCAEFQNFKEAAMYGAMALKKNHFDKEIRKLVSKWSPTQAREMQREEQAVKTIEMTWKHRLWHSGYRKRYREYVLDELEERYRVNRFDWDARSQLAYYAAKKWRPKFLFEIECIKKIQKQFRHARIVWAWQGAQRAKMTALGSELYCKFNKKPYERDIRNEVRRVANHRFCSKKHIIKKLLPILDKQDNAHCKIWKSFRSYQVRKGLLALITKRRNKIDTIKNENAILIQSIIRMKLAQIHVQAIRDHNACILAATLTIQRYIRNRNTTFKHSVYRMVNRKHAYQKKMELFLHYAILGKYKGYLRRRLIQANKHDKM